MENQRDNKGEAEKPAFFSVCSVCHDIKNDEGKWEHTDKEAYQQLCGRSKNDNVLNDWITLSHGYCNPCYEKAMAELMKK